MKKLGIMDEQVKIAMSKNCLDVLTIVLKEETQSKDIPCVEGMLSLIGMSKIDKAKWSKF